jgi:HlyD family secretion protein
VFTIAQDLTRMQVYAKTDESDTGNIRVGAPVTFQVDAFPAEMFRRRVSAVRLNAVTVQNVVTYDTVIDFDNPNERLLPGETAYVTIPTGHVSGAVLIPNAALTFNPDIPRPSLQALYAQHNMRREARPHTWEAGRWSGSPGPTPRRGLSRDQVEDGSTGRELFWRETFWPVQAIRKFRR